MFMRTRVATKDYFCCELRLRIPISPYSCPLHDFHPKSPLNTSKAGSYRVHLVEAIYEPLMRFSYTSSGSPLRAL